MCSLQSSVVSLALTTTPNCWLQRPVILCGSQKTLPVAVTTINTLAAQMDLMAGVAVLPCVFSHFSQIVIDSFLTSHW